MHNDGVISILTINSVTWRNIGKYRCRATNVDGKSAESTEAKLISNIRIY